MTMRIQIQKCNSKIIPLLSSHDNRLQSQMSYDPHGGNKESRQTDMYVFEHRWGGTMRTKKKWIYTIKFTMKSVLALLQTHQTRN